MEEGLVARPAPFSVNAGFCDRRIWFVGRIKALASVEFLAVGARVPGGLFQCVCPSPGRDKSFLIGNKRGFCAFAQDHHPAGAIP
jgi:hypothetical protein